jgi:hypothetical protein
MWLWLVNNCQVPIVVRTFGAADDHLPDEIGAMDRVVPNPEPRMRMSTVDAGGKVSEFPPRVEGQGETPDGYEAEVFSSESIPSGRAIFFSVPVNHVSKKWQMEIPFEFDLPSGKGLRNLATGGSPDMVLSYTLWDLPPERQTDVERIIRETRTRR